VIAWSSTVLVGTRGFMEYVILTGIDEWQRFLRASSEILK
jgi:hypothetical protein